MVISAFHGTDCCIDSFGKITGTLFLTDNPGLAKMFGENVFRISVTAEKVFEVDWDGCSWGGGFFPDDHELFDRFIEYASYGCAEEREYWEDNGMCVDMLASFLFDKGFDMLIVHNVAEENGFSKTEYVVSDICKLRSVTESA